MSAPWVAFGLGCIVGANAGLLIFALLSAASDDGAVRRDKLDRVLDADAEAEALAMWAEARGRR